MIVMKFGGTSVGTPAYVRRVGELVRTAKEREPVLVVVSAHAGVTDLLIELAERARDGSAEIEPFAARHQEMLRALDLPADLLDAELRQARTLLTGVALLRELTPRSRDHLLSYGERMSARVVAAHLRGAGTAARAVDGWDAGVLTDDRFGAARPLPGLPGRVCAAFADGFDPVPVVTGFIGKTERGEVTTLGRGGSDYSAALFGAALTAREIQIWTDVDGVMTTDPRLVPDARVVERVSYAEAAELAFFGAKVLHPETMQPAIESDVPLRVRNTRNPAAPGTRVERQQSTSREVVKAIALRRGVRVVNVQSNRMLGAHGFIRQLGEVFDRHRVAIDMMATSEVSVSLTVGPEADLAPVLRDLGAFSEATVLSGLAILCVVGDGLRETPGLAGRVFRSLGDASVNVVMVSQGASRRNLGIVVRDEDAKRAVQTLHAAFFSPDADDETDLPNRL